jgi:hypothetical protein
MMSPVAVFVSDYNHRKALVYKLKEGYNVEFYLHEQRVREESYMGKSQRYHEDTAEDYVLGIKNLGP